MEEITTTKGARTSLNEQFNLTLVTFYELRYVNVQLLTLHLTVSEVNTKFDKRSITEFANPELPKIVCYSA